jgi:hypothetical protein
VTNDGIVHLARTAGAFAVATVNVGASGTITVLADTGSVSLPVTMALCQTTPSTGQCLSSSGPTVTTPINSGETPTFAVFVQGSVAIPFDPTHHRVFIRFQDSGGMTRGATSVAVWTYLALQGQ